MTPDLKHPYGLRAWFRIRLPRWAIGLAGKGQDCMRQGAAHHWYNIDDDSSGCYYCRVERPGQLWRVLTPPLHEYDVVRVVQILEPRAGYERAPEIGDEGTIVSLYGENGPATVESVASDGNTIWLETFERCEVEVVWCAVTPEG